MRVERALLEELPEKKFNIGYQGEQNHTQVIISCPIMFRDYPDAVASMVVKPPQGDLYPVSLTRDGNDLTWDVSDADVAIPGEGILQLTFTDGESDTAEIIKTVYGSYSVNASLVANGEAPDPVQSWLDEAGAALATFENEIGDIRKITTATDADEGKALSPKTVVNGKVTEWEYIDLADPEVVTQAIDDWLDDHPEATTTVQDGAITEAKLNDSLKADLAWQTDVDGLMSALPYKADNRYGGTESSTYLELTSGSTWNGNSGTIQGNANKRARSNQIVYTPDMLRLTLKSGYTAYFYGNDEGIGTSFTAIVSWATSAELTNVNYKYIYVVIKRTDEGDITSDDLSDVLTLTKGTEIIPFLTKDDAVVPFGTYVTSSNYSSLLSDFNNAEVNKIYNIFGCADLISHSPYGGSQSKSGTLIVFNGETTTSNWTVQFYATKDDNGSVLFMRFCINNIFYAWKNLTSANNVYAEEMGHFVETCINKAVITGISSATNILAFGDSIVKGVGVDKAWLGYVADDTGCTVVNKSVGGALFGESVKTSTYWISTQIAGVSNTEWNNATLVIVGAGTNDAGNDTPLSELKEKVQSAITAIKAKTNAPILFITPIRRGTSSTDADLLKLPMVSGIICNVAVSNGCNVLNGFDIPIPTYTIGQITDLTQDHLHPNDTGAKVYAMAFLNAVM